MDQSFMVLEGDEEVIKYEVRNRYRTSKAALKILWWLLPSSIKFLFCGFTGSLWGNFRATQTKTFKYFYVDLYQDSVAKFLILAKKWGKRPQKYHTTEEEVGFPLYIWDFLLA